MACPNQPHERHCESCRSDLKLSLFCDACQRVQALGEKENYFSVFDQPLCYLIDRDSLEKVFDDLVMDLHPDFHTQGDARDQALSLQHTAMLHEAKDTLYDPFERGKYLLRLLVPKTGNLTVHPPQDFLMEMFELQEGLDEAERDPSLIPGLEGRIQELVAEGERGINPLFEGLLAERDNEELPELIKEGLGKLKFLLNLNHRLQETKKRHE